MRNSKIPESAGDIENIVLQRRAGKTELKEFTKVSDMIKKYQTQNIPITMPPSNLEMKKPMLSPPLPIRPKKQLDSIPEVKTLPERLPAKSFINREISDNQKGLTPLRPPPKKPLIPKPDLQTLPDRLPEESFMRSELINERAQKPILPPRLKPLDPKSLPKSDVKAIPERSFIKRELIDDFDQKMLLRKPNVNIPFRKLEK